MHGPASARAAIGETDDGDVDRGQERLELPVHLLALFARTAAGAPELDLGSAELAEFVGPDFADPVPGAPHLIDADADSLTRQRSCVRPRGGDVVRARGCRVQN